VTAKLAVAAAERFVSLAQASVADVRGVVSCCFGLCGRQRVLVAHSETGLTARVLEEVIRGKPFVPKASAVSCMPAAAPQSSGSLAKGILGLLSGVASYTVGALLDVAGRW